MTPTIACVGVLSLDWIEVDGVHKGPYPAGNALYSAVGAWLASSHPIIVARLGADYPKTMLEDVTNRGLSIAGAQDFAGNSIHVLLRDNPSGRKICYLDDSGSSFDLDSGPADLPFGPIDGVHVGPGHAASRRALLDLCRERGYLTTLDLLFVDNDEPTKEEVFDLLPRTDVFLPSAADMNRLWPAKSLRELLETFLAAGCKVVVLKMGAFGCLGSDGRSLLFLPAIPAHVIDCTGAGDAFCGAFNAEWVRTGELSSSMCWGAAAASIAIEGIGAIHGFTDDAREKATRRQQGATPQSLGSYALDRLFPPGAPLEQ